MAKEETYSKRVKSELALLSYSLEEEKGILSGFMSDHIRFFRPL